MLVVVAWRCCYCAEFEVKTLTRCFEGVIDDDCVGVVAVAVVVAVVVVDVVVVAVAVVVVAMKHRVKQLSLNCYMKPFD